MNEVRPNLERRQFVRIGTTVAGSAAFLGFLSGCGQSDSAGSTALSASKVSASNLASKARAEGGTVHFYSNIGDEAALIQDAFRKTYPWASISTYGGSADQVLSKFLTEAQGRSHIVDVATAKISQLGALKQANAITGISLSNDAAMPAFARAYLPYLHPTYSSVYCMVYNTKSGIKPPADPYDLADPSWKGKIALDQPANLGAAGTFLASRRALWGDAKWTRWLEGLKANDILMSQSSTSAYTAVLQGERDIAIDGYQDVYGQKKGTPVAAYFYPDVVVQTEGVVQSSHAPHPNMAALFINWLESSAGQQMFASSGRTPSLAINSPLSLSKLLPKNVTPLPASDLSDWYANPDEYQNIFQKYWP